VWGERNPSRRYRQARPPLGVNAQPVVEVGHGTGRVRPRAIPRRRRLRVSACRTACSPPRPRRRAGARSGRSAGSPGPCPSSSRRTRAHGWSLAELGRRTGLDPAHLGRVESSRRPPTEAIAAAFETVSPERRGWFTDWLSRVAGVGRDTSDVPQLAGLRGPRGDDPHLEPRHHRRTGPVRGLRACPDRSPARGNRRDHGRPWPRLTAEARSPSPGST
jgi:lambda repressor-like predicted transcriptional regulator